MDSAVSEASTQMSQCDQVMEPLSGKNGKPPLIRSRCSLISYPVFLDSPLDRSQLNSCQVVLGGKLLNQQLYIFRIIYVHAGIAV